MMDKADKARNSDELTWDHRRQFGLDADRERLRFGQHARSWRRISPKNVWPVWFPSSSSSSSLIRCPRFLPLLRRRLSRRQQLLVSFVRYVLLGAALLFVAVPLLAPSYVSPPAHYRALERRCGGRDGDDTTTAAGEVVPGCANPRGETVFISTILYDGDGELTGGLWGERVLRLIHMIGPDRTFLSIYESDSGAAGGAALAAFRARVPCRHAIVHEDSVSHASFGNVTFPDGSRRTKRIAFLSELRNRALRPLDRNWYQDDGDEEGDEYPMPAFDKVLFLNDIAFHPTDAAQLLFSTNQGADGRARYLAACAADYFHPLQFYDLYALRDADGHETQQKIFPLFRDRSSDSDSDSELGGLSRADMLAQRDAVRVRSCWGGMVAVQARYVQNAASADLPRPDFRAVGAHVVDPDRPRNVSAPVRFRHEPELYYDACECCLFSADLAQVASASRADADLDAADDETAIYMNPYVRVAYSESVLAWLPVAQRFERLLAPLFDLQSLVTPAPENPYRGVREGEPFVEEVWSAGTADSVDINRGRWRLVQRRGRSGLFCGVRETQVLRRERRQGFGWVNTKIPPGQALPFRSWWGKTLPPGWRGQYARLEGEEEREGFFEDDWLE